MRTRLLWGLPPMSPFGVRLKAAAGTRSEDARLRLRQSRTTERVITARYTTNSSSLEPENRFMRTQPFSTSRTTVL